MSSDAYQGIRCCVGLAIFFVMIFLINKASAVSKHNKFMKRYKKDWEELDLKNAKFTEARNRFLASDVVARPVERVKICTHSNPVMCRDCGKCIECSGGYGDDSTPAKPLCYSCGYYDGSEDDN